MRACYRSWCTVFGPSSAAPGRSRGDKALRAGVFEKLGFCDTGVSLSWRDKTHRFLLSVAASLHFCCLMPCLVLRQ